MGHLGKSAEEKKRATNQQIKTKKNLQSGHAPESRRADSKICTELLIIMLAGPDSGLVEF